MSQIYVVLKISASKLDVLKISVGKNCGTENQCPEKYTLKISAMKVTLKRSAHQISASGTDLGDVSANGTDFQRVYFPQCDELHCECHSVITYLTS